MELKNQKVDIRVSIIPTLWGESIVMRILNQSALALDLYELGFLGDTLTNFSDLLKRPNGIILITGPSGSGKSTTLYSAVNASITIKNHKYL
jgi:type II secretory ATPase GspE/PulE/Tfp pilus assembly ATPase PilB-like protein